MGTARGPSSYEHHDGRVPPSLQKGTRTPSQSSVRSHNVRVCDCSTRALLARLVREGSDSGDHQEDSSPLLPVIHQREKEREIETSHRPFSTQPPTSSPHIQNGDSGCHFQSHFRESVGDICGYRGCLLPRPCGLGISQVPRIQDQKTNVCLPVPPLRPLSCTVGFLQGDKAHQVPLTPTSHSSVQLFGRLRRLCGNTEVAPPNHGSSPGKTSQLGFQDQLGEVEPSSISVDRVPGSLLGSPQVTTFRPSGQGEFHQPSLSRDERQGGCHQTGTGKPDGTSQLCGVLHRLGETSSASSLDVVKPPHPHGTQRHPGSPGRDRKGVSSTLDTQEVFNLPCSNACTQTDPHPDDGCLVGRLVRHSSPSEGPRALACFSEEPFNELEGIEGYSPGPSGASTSLEREIDSASVGQHDSDCLSQKTRFGQACTPPHSSCGNSNTLQGLEYQPSPGSSPRSPQRPGGPGFPHPPDSDRVDTGQGNLQLDTPSRSRSPGRPFCDEGELAAGQLRFPLPGPSSSGVRCIQHGLESVDVHLPDAPNGYIAPGCPTTAAVSGQGGSDSPVLAELSLVPSHPPPLSQEASSPPDNPLLVPDDLEGIGDSPRSTLLEPSRMDTLTKPMVAGGLTELSVRVLSVAHKPTTQHQYQGTWTKFLKFMKAELVLPTQVNEYVVMNFLADQLLVEGLKYRTVAGYKSALSLPLLKVFKLKLDDDFFEFFMRGAFNLDPPKSAPMPLWSLEHLLSYLSSDIYEPLTSKGLRTITQKTLCLVMLATGRRIDEIGHLSRAHSWEEGGESVVLHWLQDYRPKHFNKDFQPGFPVLERLVSEDTEELRLCPVRAFQAYLAASRTTSRMADRTPLWTQNTTQLTKMFISTATMARHFAGDMTDVPMGPHQMRKFAASYSSMMLTTPTVTVQKMLTRMGCKTMNVLKRTYIRQVPNVSVKTVLPVGTFVPALHNTH